MFYNLFLPSQAAGADKVYFDLFNASGSPHILEIHSVRVVVSGDVAVTGTLGVDVHLTRTTAIGTGGTDATREGNSLTAATFSAYNNTTPLDSNITARLGPTGGATAGAALSWDSVFTEETNGGSYTKTELAKPWLVDVPPIIVRRGSGIRVVQGAVASVGNIGFNVLFKVVPQV